MIFTFEVESVTSASFDTMDADEIGSSGRERYGDASADIDTVTDSRSSSAQESSVSYRIE